MVKAVRLKRLRRNVERARRDYIRADAAQILKANQIKHASDIDEWGRLNREMIKRRKEKRMLEKKLGLKREEILKRIKAGR